MHKFIPMSHTVKIPDAKAAVDKEWEKLQKLPAWQMTKIKSKRKVMKEAQKEQRTVHFGTLMDVCHPKMALQFQKHTGRVVLRGDIVKDDPGSHAASTEPGSSASPNDSCKSNGCHSKATRMCRTSSRRGFS